MVRSPARVPRKTARRAVDPRRKPRGRYHHGDLRRALLEAAVRTIDEDGVERLTLRGVGTALGVSRTALYRHFRDKSALLAEVAREGFRTLRLQLLEASRAHGGGRPGFEAMSQAYVRFAVTHPAHYRVMFGGILDADAHAVNPGLAEEGAGAFAALVDALVSLQQAGLVRRDDPLQLALFVWSVVHGISMLAIDGRLGRYGPVEELVRFAADRVGTGIAAT